MLSQVLPEDEIRRNAAVAALTAAAEQKQLEMAAAGMSLQQRAPGSQLGNRNGSMTVQINQYFQDLFLFIADPVLLVILFIIFFIFLAAPI